ncbi:hypothetical protein [Acinetobacter gerneri]|uniref:Lipoprotein n=2 Tax=Acinetobacter gerneri TaxID=202952 RepID=N8ZJA7_9GAMM|nr:hypothetical protein [Acinetobacter gerneri]ENV31560.1 hypothetical protein F960_03925 [Acinetobacter gerneri DSM 14967 = CIP 107464 = MTCC 9824]EPR80383.1 hypothetical protein L289_0687 [Acinetobacter gerneri DSM 14967 = CIP 107464 = MTCC 9824]MDQ9008394.1 hypothetical protein [Acinetobacter gerneri]MDQ9012641.1 hypothetical protein [Acinetobacter gerneri]MDQ9024076.1 hypothetical protein [Acinetobacter gerneri]
MSKVQKLSRLALTAFVASSILSGCSYVVKSGANVAIGFSNKHIVPPILKMGDVDMACHAGTALTPAIMATKDMGADPTKMAVLLYSASGMCAERQSVDAELRYLRASKNNQISEAQDARVEQKRWAALASERQYTAYQLFAERWQAKYKFKLGDSCPKMHKDLDQMVYLLGMMSGLQAMTNDINSGGQVNVPKDIAGIVERGMACLDNTKFWGAPNATRATIWTLLPGSGDGKPDPYQTLNQSMQIADQKGVRLAYALNAMTAQASGDNDKIRAALQAYGASRADDKPVNPEFRLIDGMAGQIMQEIADRYWTENTGQRAPDDGYTNFWDSKEDNSEIADLFSGDEGKSDTSVPSDASPEQAAPEASTEEPSP